MIWIFDYSGNRIIYFQDSVTDRRKFLSLDGIKKSASKIVSHIINFRTISRVNINLKFIVQETISGADPCAELVSEEHDEESVQNK